MRRSRGFTLVEIMVVVAIVGVLAVLAATEYDQMLAKSRTVEATTNLERIHQLQTGYFVENHEYGTFRQIGFWVEGRARYDYCYGTVITTCIYASTTGVSGAVTAENDAGAGGPLLALLLPVFVPPRSGPSTAMLGGNPHVTDSSFEVVARGRISRFKPLDAWSVDDGHALKNTIRGY